MGSQVKSTLRNKWLLPILVLSLCTFATPNTAKADQAVSFMKKVKKELLRAAKSKSQAAFDRAIQRYADIPRIAINSLGQHSKKLAKSRRPTYYKGVKKYMTRYFTDQAKAYQIVAADVHSPSRPDGKYREVDTTVYLDSGWSYSVTWRVGKRTGRYKVTDVKVMGLWLTPMQRNVFEDYVSKAGGNVNALVWALNQ